MDDLGFNKIAAAVLGTGLAFLGVMTLSEIVVPESDFSDAYLPEVQLAVVDDGPGAPLPFPQPSFIAALDVERGAKVFKKCQSCHNAEPGGANGTGPALYGVMGRQMGQHAGFKYSAAMQGRAAPWTWEEMNGFLEKPKDWLPGTAMNYIGLKKEEDRAAVMAYLNAKTDNPLPVPAPAAIPATALEASLDDAAAQPDSETYRISDDPQAEEIPGQRGVGLNAVQAELVNGEDDAVERDEDTVIDEQNSAGEVTPDDPSIVDPAVREAIPGEQVVTEVEDGPLSEDEVLKLIGG